MIAIASYASCSRVGYGPEGGTGPNWLAYVRIPGQGRWRSRPESLQRLHVRDELIGGNLGALLPA